MIELKEYTLFFKKYDLGTVTELSNEWPRPSGTIDLNRDLKDLNEETQYIFSYFDFSIKASYLIENGELENEYDDFISDHESLHLNLINSDEWFLVDRFGKYNSIVVPILQEDNSIVWTAFKE